MALRPCSKHYQPIGSVSPWVLLSPGNTEILYMVGTMSYEVKHLFFTKIRAFTKKIWAPFFSAYAAVFLASVWFVGSGSSTYTTGGNEEHIIFKPLQEQESNLYQLIESCQRDTVHRHIMCYLSFFWDRLSSMYLYFWYCSSNFVRTASAVSLPGCFMKESTSSCKLQQSALRHCGSVTNLIIHTLAIF